MVSSMAEAGKGPVYTGGDRVRATSCSPWGTDAVLRHSPDIAPFSRNRHTRSTDWYGRGGKG